MPGSLLALGDQGDRGLLHLLLVVPLSLCSTSSLCVLGWLIRMVILMMKKMVVVLLSLLCISLVRMLFDNVGDDCDNVDDHDSDCCGGDDDHP